MHRPYIDASSSYEDSSMTMSVITEGIRGVCVQAIACLIFSNTITLQFPYIKTIDLYQ